MIWNNNSGRHAPLLPAHILGLATLVAFAVFLTGCERPFVPERAPAIEVLSPDLETVRFSPTLPLEIRAASFRPVASVRIGGETLSFDSANGIWRDTLELDPGLNTIIISALDEEGVEGIDTAFAVYLPLSVSAAAPALPEPRGGHTATLLSDGSVLVAGGAPQAGGTAQPEAYLLPGGITGFQPAGALNAARVGHTATLLPDGRVLVVGGFRADTLSGGANFVQEVEIFDPATGQFTVFPYEGEPIRRARHTASVLESDGETVLHLYGGVGPSGATGTAPREDLSTYRIVDDTLRSTGPSGRFLLDVPVSGHTQVPLGTASAGEVAQYLITGTHYFRGTGDSESFVLRVAGPSLIDAYDTGVLQTPRTRHAAAPVLPGAVLVYGGTDETTDDVRESMEIFVQETNRYFRVPEAAGTKRFGHTATILPSLRILVIGGFGPGGSGIASSEYVDLVSE